MKRAIKTYGGYFLAILFLAAIGLGTGFYILVKQRLQNPLAEVKTVKAEFTSSAGLTPGLGQPVNVAGVKVGVVSSVDLRDGRALVTMQINPGKLPKVYTDAKATLVPNTPLKDMLIELEPGGPPSREAKEGFVIELARTDPPIDWDDVTSALDADTRTFFEVLVSGLDQGTKGRGKDLNQLFKALGPTTEQVETLMGELSGRRRELERLVHNLAILGRAVGTKDKELQQLIGATDRTLEAVAAEDAALQESVAKLPAVLAETRASLPRLTAFGNEFARTANQLIPTIRRLPAALRATRPLTEEAVPILRREIRPLVRELQPLARDLTPAAQQLSAVTPELTSAFRVLNYVVNTLAYNPPGEEEGYLFWIAWFTNNGASVFSTEDANGAVWRGLALLNCSGLQSEPLLAPVIEIFTGVTGCTSGGGILGGDAARTAGGRK